MTQWLRQQTIGTVPFGPFVGTADGYTPGTALTISQADIRLSKNGAAFAQTANSAGAAHMENGHYAVPLGTADTDTLGRLRVAVYESGALPAWQDFMVVPQQVWDSYFGADALQVHAVEISNGLITAAAIATDAIDADALAADAIAEINATVDTAISDAALATAANLATLTGYVDTEVAAIKAKTDNLPSDPADDSDIDAQLAAIAGYLDTEIAAIKAKTDNLPAAPAATGDIPTVAQILTTAMTEAYPTLGATMTVAQALYAIHQFLTEKAVSGTGVTTKKRNQSTTAKTYALDDADEPTSIEEAS